MDLLELDAAAHCERTTQAAQAKEQNGVRKALCSQDEIDQQKNARAPLSEDYRQQQNPEDYRDRGHPEKRMHCLLFYTFVLGHDYPKILPST